MSLNLLQKIQNKNENVRRHQMFVENMAQGEAFTSWFKKLGPNKRRKSAQI